MEPEELKQLKDEIDHIFQSGANETRVFEMVKAFIEKGRPEKKIYIPSGFVYLQSDDNQWTVGHYNPEGGWVSEGNYDHPEKAAKRVSYLNGGRKKSFFEF